MSKTEPWKMDNKYEPPFIIKTLRGNKYHLVKEASRGYYKTCCGLRINYGTIDDQSGTEVARKTMLRKDDFEDSFREPCQNCANSKFWASKWRPNIHFEQF